MDWSRAETLLVGHDEQIAERFLLHSIGVSASTFLVLTVGWQVWQAIAGGVGVLFTVVYLVGALLFASGYAYRNDGFLVTLFGTFVVLLGYAVVVGMHFLLCLGAGSSGCPTLVEKLSFGVLLAAGTAVPVGGSAFVVGVGGRRLRASRTEAR